MHLIPYLSLEGTVYEKFSHSHLLHTVSSTLLGNVLYCTLLHMVGIAFSLFVLQSKNTQEVYLFLSMVQRYTDHYALSIYAFYFLFDALVGLFYIL